MVDSISKEKRSWVMSRIRGRDTKPELIVRSLLHRCGFRYSLRHSKLPGRPDLVMRKYRTVIFVHGCFWHRHQNCRQATMPKSRQEFWQDKFARTIERDQRHLRQLQEMGWRPLIVWECQVIKDPVGSVRELIRQLAPERTENIQQYLPPKQQILQVAESRLQYQLDHIAKK